MGCRTAARGASLMFDAHGQLPPLGLLAAQFQELLTGLRQARSSRYLHLSLRTAGSSAAFAKYSFLVSTDDSIRLTKAVTKITERSQ
jgi:hypothetical protein